MNERASVLRPAALAVALAAGLLAACGTPPLPGAVSLNLGEKPPQACATLTAPLPATVIGLPSGDASIDSATWMPVTPLAVAERGATPAGRITPNTPAYCRVLGRIAPLDPKAPPILFQINLPAQWNGRSVQYGGGAFNGVLISGLALLPGARYEQPTPLAQGYVTYGTDSGHQNQAGQPPQAFALNDEALENFAHASYKKVRDVAVAMTHRAYGSKPARLYFVGSSEGGREGLVMAQRYPYDFDGIFSRVPVINWTGLQHAGTRNGIASMGEGWLRPAQVKLVHDAVLKTCDAADGLADGVVSNFEGCLRSFDPASLRCTAGTGTGGDACLADKQVQAVRTLRSDWRSPVPLAHGVTGYPGWSIGGEGTPASGPTGGWSAWWLGSAEPAVPPVPANGIAWFYGSGALQYFYARDPQGDVRQYRPENFAARIAQVSQLMDGTNPELSTFQARGGKLIVLEHMADYAQSPFAGIRYYESVVQGIGLDRARAFMRLYTAPGVDHVGSGAPANVDMFGALVAWTERGLPPEGLELAEQDLNAPKFPVLRSRPLCEWPAWPRYRGGDAAQAGSFECTR
ncbi:tannase/feruloyl esterase family alpha/beta hydrolase [uncultured Ramlibacter sp.]|uniref:tannase/feruloyl esterase family alpha/beta hydrolase n=1 Tax=uncultured Ramlibacter sp. TaxID=260755 RepID=UPI002618D488|nr:tannase/feruloyl esterase family alpha/beta hydrolase [uncultured Ramlibacter sp.]